MRIFQPERHNQPLEKALLGFEGNLPHIRGFDWFLVTFGIQFDVAEIFGPLELVQKVINSWDWVPILNNDLVQCLIANTKSPGPVLLLYQFNRAPTG